MKPIQFMPGLFGFDVPVDGSTSSSVKKKAKAWPDAAHFNPMVRAYGRHEDPDLRCKNCKYLFYKQFARRYYKCDLRGNTNGTGTDHRKHWPACKKHEERTGEITKIYG